MKKLYFITLAICSLLTVVSVQASVTVNVTTAGTLEQLLFDQEAEEYAEIAELIVTGSINSDDIATINLMAKDYALRTVDLSAANVENNTFAAQAFKETKLEHITVPKTLVAMGYECFYSTSLQSIVFPTTGLTEIPLTCFTWSTALTELEIPEGVTTLGQQSLVFCTALKKLTLPSTLTHIGENAILGDYSFAYTAGFPIPLTEIYAKMKTVPTCDAIAVALGDAYWGICTLYVPIGTSSLYAADVYEAWYGFGMVQNIVEYDYDNTTSATVLNASNIKVYSSSSNNVTIEGLVVNSQVSIYSMTGALVKSFKTNSIKTNVTVPVKGIYILKSGTQSIKFSSY